MADNYVDVDVPAQWKQPVFIGARKGRLDIQAQRKDRKGSTIV